MKFDFMSTGSQGGSRRNKRNVVTLSNLFETEDNVGYIKVETLKELVKKLENEHGYREQYSTFFDCARDGHLIQGPVRKRTHLQHNKEYIFLNMRRGRMQSQSTIYLFDNLEKFIQEYADGRITIDFGWDDLVNFCNNH